MGGDESREVKRESHDGCLLGNKERGEKSVAGSRRAPGMEVGQCLVFPGAVKVLIETVPLCIRRYPSSLGRAAAGKLQCLAITGLA